MSKELALPEQYSLKPIGIVHSCFKEKFAIPRQPALVPAAKGEIELFSPYDDPVALEGLEEVSHLWLSFIFHQALPKENEVRLRVRPPRLGGNKKLGVFATRATHRPNPLGLSVVKLDGIKNGRLQISGIVLLDGTPIVDIKPYLPYADSVSDACNGIAPAAPEPKVDVSWQAQALEQLAVLKPADMSLATVEALIVAMIALDPRPAYKQSQDSGNFAMAVFGLDVQWQMQASNIAQIHNIIGR